MQTVKLIFSILLLFLLISCDKKVNPLPTSKVYSVKIYVDSADITGYYNDYLYVDDSLIYSPSNNSGEKVFQTHSGQEITYYGFSTWSGDKLYWNGYSLIINGDTVLQDGDYLEEITFTYNFQ